jgi:hypothetical protein
MGAATRSRWVHLDRCPNRVQERRDEGGLCERVLKGDCARETRGVGGVCARGF